METIAGRVPMTELAENRSLVPRMAPPHLRREIQGKEERFFCGSLFSFRIFRPTRWTIHLSFPVPWSKLQKHHERHALSVAPPMHCYNFHSSDPLGPNSPKE
jgi:hypothetical protein